MAKIIFIIVIVAVSLPGCSPFHSYEGDVSFRDVTLHFRSGEEIDRLWKKCGGPKSVQAFAILGDDGACDIWILPPEGEDDDRFSGLLYHELGHCEDPAFGTTYEVEPDCTDEIQGGRE